MGARSAGRRGARSKPARPGRNHGRHESAGVAVEPRNVVHFAIVAPSCRDVDDEIAPVHADSWRARLHVGMCGSAGSLDRRREAPPPRLTRFSAVSSIRQNHGMDLSPLGVRVTAGTLREPAGVVLHHQWTDEGVVASPAVKRRPGAAPVGSSVRLARRVLRGRTAWRQGGRCRGRGRRPLRRDGHSTVIEYSLTLDSTAPAEALERLGAVVGEVAGSTGHPCRGASQEAPMTAVSPVGSRPARAGQRPPPRSRRHVAALASPFCSASNIRSTRPLT